MKKFIAIFMAALMVVSLAACGGKSEDKVPDASYQAILDEYSAKLKEEAPKIVEEFNEEAKDVSDSEALGELKTEKEQKIADICEEGSQKMRDLGEDFSVWGEWHNKLEEVREEQGKLLDDAYETASASLK